MLTLDELQKFENELLSVGDERTFRESRSQKIASFVDEKGDRIEQQAKELDLEKLDEDLETIAGTDKVQEEREKANAAHLEKKEKVHQVLSSMFDEVFEEEGLNIDEMEAAGDEAEEDEFSPFEEDTEDTSGGAREDFIEDQDESPFETPEGDSFEEDFDSGDALKASDQDSQFQEEAGEPLTPQDTVTIDTDKLSEDEQKILEDGSFVLPAAYLVNKPYTEKDEGSQEAEKKEDIQFLELLSDAGSLFDSDTGAEEPGDRFFGHVDPSTMGFVTEEDLDRGPEKYRTDRDFSPEDEQLLMQKLSGYNLYLSQAIVHILENEELADNAERLIDLIFSDARPQIVHHEVERLYGEVELFQDNNIYDSEELRKHFITVAHILHESANIFITRVFPTIAAVAIFAFYAYNFLYKPLTAIYYYEKGYDDIKAEEYEEGEQNFSKATSFWIMKRYYFRYADVYKEKRRYNDAKDKYYQIIFGNNPEINGVLQNLFEEDRLFVAFTINGESYIPANLITYNERAFLAAIDYEVHQAANYDRSLKLFNLWIDKKDTSASVLISFADMYLVMYDETKNQFYLDQARSLYDNLTFITENSDKSLILRSRWAIRAGDTKFLNEIVGGVFASRERFKISDELVVPLVEVVKYELRQGKTRYIADTIDSLQKQYPDLLVIPYLYALYYDLIPDYAEKKRMLLTSIAKFEQRAELSNEERYDYIDARIRLSELYLYDENNILAAKENITKAQIVLEQNTIKYKDVALYRLYFIASQIELLKGNIARSQEFLDKSQDFGYNTKEALYHQGLLNFLRKDWAGASKIFTEIATENGSELLQNKRDQSILYLAIANSMLLQKNYAVAVMYYSKILDILNSFAGGDYTIFSIDTSSNVNVVNIQSRKAQIENNLGVALYYLSKQKPEGNINEALLHLQKSSVVFQNLTRDNDVYVRKSILSTPQVNTDTILLGGEKLAIYSDISYYLHSESYWLVQQKINKTLPVN